MELGDAELREVVAARLGPNVESVLQSLINTGKAELFMTGELPNQVAYVRIKSYQWKKETGLKVDQTYQGVTQKTDNICLEDLVQDTMGTIEDFEGQYMGSNSMFEPMQLTDTRLLQNNAQASEQFRQFQCPGGNLFDFFIFLFFI